MSANTYALDVLTRHQIYLHRYSSGIVNRMLPLLDDIADDIANKILKADLTEFQFNRLSIMQADVSQAISAALGNVNTALNDELIDLVEYEAGFTNRMLDDMLTIGSATVNAEALAASLTNSTMTLTSGKKTATMTIDQAFNQFAGTAARDVGNAVRIGIAQGDTTKKIADTVTRMTETRTKAQAEALIRTAANHASTVARSAVYEENSDVLDGEIFTATLDNHTTINCASLDGKRFDVGKGPQPPIHFNCRSVRIPDVNPNFTLAKLSGERASMDGPVTNKNFSGWLRDQSKDFQDDYFSQFTDGKDRAKLFRNGGLSMEKFTDNRAIVYTMDELRALEPKAFERANL